MEGLAHAIRVFRGERTQAEVAGAAGIDATTWSFYETGRRQPGEVNLGKVCQGLGCTRLELEATAWECRRRDLEAVEATDRQPEEGD